MFEDKVLSDFNHLSTELKGTSSRLEKERILKSYIDNEGCKYILKYLYDPMIVSGISDKKLSKLTFCSNSTPSRSIIDVLEYLKNNNTGRDIDIAYLQQYIQNVERSNVDLVEAIFTKSLRLGIDNTTLNKVYGNGFIQTFNVMLAENFFDFQKYASNKCLGISQKLDGIRCLAVCYDSGEIRFYTRQGQDYGKLPQIEEELKKFPKGYVYDGELITKCEDYSEFDVFDSGDTFRKTASIAMRDGIKTGLCFHIFDVIPVTEFFSGKSSENAEIRKNMLSEIFSDIRNTYWVENVPTLAVVNSIEEVEKWHKYAVSMGWEGVMANVLDAPYQCKRTKDLLKVKKFTTVDCRCYDVFEGTGKYSGMLGGIRLKYYYNGVECFSDCGSGFTDEERIYYWNNPQSIVGHVVEIQVFEISKNKDGKFGLRFPVWINRFREDKTEI